MTITDYDVRSLYLDLLRRNLTRFGMHERMPSDWPLRRRLLLKTVNTFGPKLRGAGARDQHMREVGLDWPAEAETMIGMKRLTSLQHCVETVLADDIPGDLVETGVWRGGACILMRAVLAAYGDHDAQRVAVLIPSRACRARTPQITRRIKGLGQSLLRASWECRKRTSGRISSAMGCWMTRSVFSQAGSKTRCTTPRLNASRC